MKKSLSMFQVAIRIEDKLEQQLCSAIEGCNHDGLVFITSSSRINLKVFSQVIQFLAGELLWDYANIYETKKDSDLNYINYNSKLLIRTNNQRPN